MFRYRFGAELDEHVRVLQRKAAPTPGKISRTLELDAGGMFDVAGTLGLLEEHDAGAPAASHEDPFAMHLIAERGVAGASSPLPHLDAIQRSFGPAHDVSGIEAHVGGAAASASDAIGARAYATGGSVAFRESPDLFTAAHEAAHVVQQRAGVHLAGGVGAEGDAYERHADAVAERVVRGESAADLLAPYAGGRVGGGAQRAVQRSAERAFAVAEMNKIKEALEKRPGKRAESIGADGVFTKFTKITQQTLNEIWHGDELEQAFRKKQADGKPLTPYQQDFLRRWDHGDVHVLKGYSSCMELTGAFAESQLHLDGAFRRFDLDTYAPESWVEAAPGVFPKEGDLVRTKGGLLHTRLSYSAPTKEGDDWDVLESGQGPIGKHDAMHFKRDKYDSAKVLGWMDIDKRANHDARERLAGTWHTTSGGEPWLYTFPTSGNAVHYVHENDATNVGSGTWEPAGSNVLLKWKSSTESWAIDGIRAGGGGKHPFKRLTGAAALQRELASRKWKVTAPHADWIYTFSGANRVDYVDPTWGYRGGGTWTASGRDVTIQWDTRTVETWKVPSPVVSFKGYQNKLEVTVERT